MKNIPYEIAKSAREMNVQDYLLNYEPHLVFKDSANQYRLKNYDSLVISNGFWNWTSRQIDGKSAYTFLMKVYGCSEEQAIRHIANCQNLCIPIIKDYNAQKPKELTLPTKDDDNYVAKKYLKSRRIDSEIVDYFIEKGLIYQSIYRSKSTGFTAKNVTFVGYDRNGEIRYAQSRRTGESKRTVDAKPCRSKKSGKQLKPINSYDASGSDKRFSFAHKSETHSNDLYVFEAPIDLLSFATLLKFHEVDFRNFNMLSLSGVSVSNENAEYKLPIALVHCLENNTNTEKIALCFDNDEVGKGAAKDITNHLSFDYIIMNYPPKQGKDYNDYLQILYAKLVEKSAKSEKSFAR